MEARQEDYPPGRPDKHRGKRPPLAIVGPTQAEIDAANAGRALTGTEKRLVNASNHSPLRILLAALGITAGGAAVYGAFKAPAIIRSIQQTRLDNQLSQEKPLIFQQSETKELSLEEIKGLTEIPLVNMIGDKYVSTVSSAMQAKAQQLGYKAIYQGDPNDTVGRTLITKDRQVDEKDWSTEDLGFGRGGTTVRGIFKAWVPDPSDPNQKEKIYALLEDPIKKKDFLVAIQLFPFDPNKSDVRPTWFAVDNLNYGPDYLKAKSAIAGFPLSGINAPDPNDPPNRKWKKATDYQTFNELLREKGISLQDLAKSGDYLIVSMQTAGVDESTGTNRYKTDDLGVARSMVFAPRRFNGFQEWQAEVAQ